MEWNIIKITQFEQNRISQRGANLPYVDQDVKESIKHLKTCKCGKFSPILKMGV